MGESRSTAFAKLNGETDWQLHFGDFIYRLESIL